MEAASERLYVAGSGLVEILSVVGIQRRGRLVMAEDETSTEPWEGRLEHWISTLAALL